MEKITPETLRGWLGDMDLFILDVRNQAAWEGSRAKIRQAHRFDPARWSPDAAGDIPKDNKIVLY
jgi:rhodanese-related sulfurtransferase